MTEPTEQFRKIGQVSEQFRRDVARLDRMLDELLRDQLMVDAMLLKEHGASTRDVRCFLLDKRKDYENAKGTAMVGIVRFLLDDASGPDQSRLN